MHAAAMINRGNVILALDMGTTGFKSSLVSEDGIFADTVLTEKYLICRKNGKITFPADEYFNMAVRLLKRSCACASEKKLRIDSIGITSQAQTYVPVGKDGKAVSDAVIWLDGRAESEADEVAAGIADFPSHSGFPEPSAQMFLPKIVHLKNKSPAVHSSVWKFLLLNEYIIFRLTGETYGDSSNQGMGGFFDISKNEISKAALSLAGIDADQLARPYPPSSFGRPLTSGISEMLGIDKVKVYSCGNDQSCAAAGAGLSGENDILCNFGTAMVVYSLKKKQPLPVLGNQIVGISSLRNHYFLLGFESECGNILETLQRNFYGGNKFGFMFEEAFKTDLEEPGIRGALAAAYPGIRKISALQGEYSRAAVCRALMEKYADIFEDILAGVSGNPVPGKIFASGGLSLSEDWLHFLEKRCALKFTRIKSCHPALEGVYKTIKQNEVNDEN